MTTLLSPQHRARSARGMIGAAALVAAAGFGGVAGASSSTAPDDAADEAGSTVADGDWACTTALGEPVLVDSFADLDMSGITVEVGSKDFVEQFVLGHLLIVALEEAGATTVDSTNLGGTNVNRDALLAGEIDTYWEYNGTGWTVHLAQEDPSFDRAELTDGVCVLDLEENDIRWLGVSEFNNTYGFATAGDSPAAGGDLQAMADYIEANPDAVVCLETEFPNRPDGMVLFEEATGVIIPDDQIEILETGVIYNETATGNCTFGEIFTTDGRIPALGLDVVDDPGVFILYNVSITLSDSLYQQAPEAWQAIADTLLNGLDDDTMAELNRQVSEEGADPNDVAREHLTSLGLVGDGSAA